MYYFFKILAWVPLRVLYPLTVKNKNIPKGKVILISNHRSNLDSVLLHNILWCKPRVLAKKEVFEKKGFRWFLKMTGTIPVDREKVELSTIKSCMAVLKSDKKLMIFPEGTRSKSDNENLNEVKNGVALIAMKANSPIVPIWIKKKPRLFRFNKIIFGEPFDLTSFNGRKIDHDTLEEVSKLIANKLEATKNI